MPVIALTLTTAGHNLLRDALKGADSAKITYFALGTSNATPSSSDTKLGNEVFRKQVSSYANGVSTGEALINCYVSQSDAINVDIEEIAAYGGNSASSTTNSGVLLGRGLWSHNPKLNTESIVLQLDIIV